MPKWLFAVIWFCLGVVVCGWVAEARAETVAHCIAHEAERLAAHECGVYSCYCTKTSEQIATQHGMDEAFLAGRRLGRALHKRGYGW